MCGICGWTGPAGEAIGPDALTRMSDTIRHRGPDGPGAWHATSGDRAVALGHRRLKVIDLTDAAHQPMTGAGGQVTLTYNGEIYNFRELREELRAAGARFESTGDTEVVLRAYETWGEAGIARLDGMFALAVWDGRTDRLVLARDRAGKKPLFYWTDGRSLAFGSEIKAVLACPGVPRAVDESRLAEYLTFGYVPHPHTLHRGIKQVPPASIVSFDATGLQPPRAYWSALGHSEARGEVQELLDAAVRRRMVSDVPLGALLSGGMDSSVIVALMAKHAAEPVHTFAIGFPDEATFDERGHARRVADHLGTRHTEYAVRLDAVRLMDRLLWHHDQPYMDSSAIPTYVVCGLAREHVTVVLTGDGGDEVFGGYDRFRAARVPRVPAPLARGARGLVGRLPADLSYHSPRNRALRLLELADRPLEERYHSWSAVTGEGLVLDLVSPDVVAAEPLAASMERRYAEAAGLPALDRILYANFSTYLPDDLLVKTDRMSMAHSLEARSPLLDTALIERLASVPARDKVGVRRLKPLLARACADLVPPEILTRRKHGFGVPMGTWFQGELGTMFEDEVLAVDARSSAVLRQPVVRRVYEEHRSGAVDHGHRLWTLLTLERWLRTLETPLTTEPPGPVVDAAVSR